METTDAKAVARLLRFIGNTGCSIEMAVQGADQAKCRLYRDGRSQLSPRSVVEAAHSRGLVHWRGDRIFATSEARAFLRRYLAAREEAFLDQHRTVDVLEIREDGETGFVRVNVTSSPLAALARLKDGAGRAWFPGDALSAGERLASDFHYANLQPKITPSYEPRMGNRMPSAPGAGTDMKDSVLAARLRVGKAVDAMGPDLSGVALDVCCFEKGLELVERERQWPARSAKLMLKTALLQLHRHYNPPSAPGRRSHIWGGEGYRPEL